MITLSIGGTAYTTLKDTFQAKQELTYKVDSCQFNVQSTTKPSEYAEVIVTDGTDRKFAGVVVTSQLVDDRKNIWNVVCYDYSAIIDRKLVVEDYTAQTADYIFSDLITKYVDPSFTSTVSSGAPSIDFIQFNYKKVSECFKDLCDRVGWQWYVDYSKDIKFFPATGVLGSAPESITSILQVDQFDFSLDVQDLRNRVFVLGGTELSDYFTYEIVADGLARAWTLPHKPHDISVEFNEIALSVGIENISDPATTDILLNFQEKRMVLGDSFVTPVAGTTLSFVYKYDIDVITIAENSASQASIGLIQGTDGIYEYQIIDKTLTTIEAAEAAGQKEINQFSDPYIEGSYISRVEGYQAGQLLTINLPDYGINNTYMINSVQSQYVSNQWEYVIQFGGRLLGVADYLQALISNMNNADNLSPTDLLKKFITNTENINLSDELTVSTRSSDNPWYIEDSIKFRINATTATETSALYTAVGTYLIISTSDSRGWGTSEYNDGTNWNAIRPGELVALSNTVLQVRSDRKIVVYNFKKAYDETDVICGEVVCLGT
jgi:hypothetical protein